MRRILWLGLLLAVIICARPAAVLAADEPEKDSWTVLIYMCGADLESKDGVLSYCLEEIAESDSGRSSSMRTGTKEAKSLSTTRFMC